MGGAFGRIPQDATPFPGRSARYWLNVYGFWTDPADDAARTAFIRGLAADMEPHGAGGQYVNFMAAEDPGTAAGAPGYDAQAGRRVVVDRPDQRGLGADHRAGVGDPAHRLGQQ